MRLVSYLRYVLHLGGVAPKDSDPDILRERDRQHRLGNKLQLELYPRDNFTHQQMNAWRERRDQTDGQR